MNLPGYDAWKLSAPDLAPAPDCPFCADPEAITDEDADQCTGCHAPCCRECLTSYRDEDTGEVLENFCPKCEALGA